MKYLRQFETNSEFETSRNQLDKPYVVLTKDDNKVHYSIDYSIDDIESPFAYVDLGLPSGLKWATMNVGATSETDYGDYFMWGSITPDTDKPCDWAHAPFNNGYETFNEEYFNSIKDDVCPNGILAPEFDAVHQIMKSKWRMPTKEDYMELISNTNNIMVENYQGTGVNGMVFTSKIDENKSIFIPASGTRGTSSITGQGYSGGLWCSNLGSDTFNYKYAYLLGFNPYLCDVSEYPYEHYKGYSLRGVLDV